MRSVGRIPWQAVSRLLPFLALLLIPIAEARYLWVDALRPVYPPPSCAAGPDCAKAMPVSVGLLAEIQATPASSPAVLPTALPHPMPQQRGVGPASRAGQPHPNSSIKATPRAPPCISEPQVSMDPSSLTS